MPDDSRKWAGFSDYEKVASRLHDDINRAVDAYSHIDSRYKQGVGITPQTAVSARESILRITKRLAREVKKNRHSDDTLEEIHGRWNGDDGLVAELEATSFLDGNPPWLGQLVDDIIEAGWELGYLKAGREKLANPDDVDQQAKDMFE